VPALLITVVCGIGAMTGRLAVCVGIGIGAGVASGTVELAVVGAGVASGTLGLAMVGAGNGVEVIVAEPVAGLATGALTGALTGGGGGGAEAVEAVELGDGTTEPGCPGIGKEDALGWLGALVGCGADGGGAEGGGGGDVEVA
jgi:hypothetical protein